jgi:hypothetical protein
LCQHRLISAAAGDFFFWTLSIADLRVPLGVAATIQRGGQPAEQAAPRRPLRFCRPVDGVLRFGGFAQDGDKVLFGVALLRRHDRCSWGRLFRSWCEAREKPEVNFVLRMNTGTTMEAAAKPAGFDENACGNKSLRSP